MNITALPKDVPGFEVNLENVAVWVISEMRIHGSLPDDITFNLKIDGRPFHGKHEYCTLPFVLSNPFLLIKCLIPSLFQLLPVKICLFKRRFN